MPQPFFSMGFLRLLSVSGSGVVSRGVVQAFFSARAELALRFIHDFGLMRLLLRLARRVVVVRRLRRVSVSLFLCAKT
jgi:hypothetical protein